MELGRKLDHIVYAVKNLDQAIDWFEPSSGYPTSSWRRSTRIKGPKMPCLTWEREYTWKSWRLTRQIQRFPLLIGWVWN